MTEQEKIAALEAEVARLQKIIDKCQGYIANGEDGYFESCAQEAYESVCDESGEVVRIDRGGIVASSYCALIEYDDGSTVWIEEPTEEAAVEKVKKLQGARHD